MTATMLAPRFEVDSETLHAFDAFARMRGMTVDEALKDYVDSFTPKARKARIVGYSERGPILDIPDELVYKPRYAPDGSMILPKSWADEEEWDE